MCRKWHSLPILFKTGQKCIKCILCVNINVFTFPRSSSLVVYKCKNRDHGTSQYYSHFISSGNIYFAFAVGNGIYDFSIAVGFDCNLVIFFKLEFPVNFSDLNVWPLLKTKMFTTEKKFDLFSETISLL